MSTLKAIKTYANLKMEWTIEHLTGNVQIDFWVNIMGGVSTPIRFGDSVIFTIKNLGSHECNIKHKGPVAGSQSLQLNPGRTLTVTRDDGILDIEHIKANPNKDVELIHIVGEMQTASQP